MRTLSPIFSFSTTSSVKGVRMRITSSMVRLLFPLDDRFLVAVAVTLNVDRQRDARNVGRIGLDVNVEGSHPSPQSHRSDPELVDLLQDLFFKTSHLRIRVPLAQRAEERPLGNQGCLFEGPSDSHADHNGRARVRPRLLDPLKDELLYS